MARRREDEHPGLSVDPDEILIEEVPVLALDLDPDDATPRPPPHGVKPPQRRRMLERAPPPPAPKSSLAQRATSRPMSAQEALAQARRVEQQKKNQASADLQAKRDQAKRLAQQAKQRAESARREQQQAVQRAEVEQRMVAARVAAETRQEAEQVARDRAAFAPRDTAEITQPTDTFPRSRVSQTAATARDPLAAMVAEGEAAEVLDQLGVTHELLETFTTIPIETVTPLWQAHIVRARHEADLPSLVAAQEIVATLERSPGDLVACRVGFSGKQWAVWIDLERDRVLAVMAPAELYLVGLS